MQAISWLLLCIKCVEGNYTAILVDCKEQLITCISVSPTCKVLKQIDLRFIVSTGCCIMVSELGIRFVPG